MFWSEIVGTIRMAVEAFGAAPRRIEPGFERVRGVAGGLSDRLRRSLGEAAGEEKVALLGLVLVLAFLSWP